MYNLDVKSLLSAPTVNYCEPILNGIIKRPWAALSNVAFFISGILILIKGKGSRLSKLFGVVAILVGVCSSVYDITYFYGAQLLDLSAMLVFVSLLLYLNLQTLSLSNRWLTFGLTAAFIASVGLIVSQQGYSGDIIFGLYVLAVIITELALIKRRLHINFRQWVLALALFILGFAAWIPDNKQLICFDIGLFNGRAVFHYLCASTIYLLYRYYEGQPEGKVDQDLPSSSDKN